MKTAFKVAASGVCALVAYSTATFAQEIPLGITAAIDFATPLPTGIYAFDIGAIGAFERTPTTLHGNLYGNISGISWSSPWEIAGAKFGITGVFSYADFETSDGGGLNHPLHLSPNSSYSGPWLAIVDANLKWNFGNLSFGQSAGILYLFGSGNFLAAYENNYRDNTNFEGSTDFAWRINPGLEALLNVRYGNANFFGVDNNWWISFEGAFLQRLGKAQIGPIICYSTSLSGTKYDETYVGAKVGYDFDGVSAAFRIMQSVGYGGAVASGSDTKIFFDIAKPLYVAQNEPLK